MEKLTSGRWIMTVALTLTVCTMGLMDLVPADDIVKLAMVVVTFYFTKKDGDGKTN